MPKVSRPGEHDPELTERQGMSTEGKEVDETETMASTGDEPREKPADHYALAEHGHHRFGWETGADLDEGDLDFFEEDQPEDED